MTLSDFAGMNYLNPSNVIHWDRIEAAIARRLDSAIRYLGSIRITSTYRSYGKGYHPRGQAVDFQPTAGQKLWHIFLILKKLGFRRIGISPTQNLIHIDAGPGEYYFLEDGDGKDLGPITASKNAALARSIPGYGTEPASIQASTFPSATAPAGAAIQKQSGGAVAVILAAALIATHLLAG